MRSSLWFAALTAATVTTVDGQYSSLHEPYNVNFKSAVLENPSQAEIHEKFFETLTYANQEDSQEEDEDAQVPVEFLVMLQRISYDFMSVRDTFETGVTNMETCATCRSLVGVLTSIQRVVSESSFFRGVSFVCQWFRLNTRTVCSGLVSKYKDELSYILTKINERSISTEELCTLVFGPSCGTLTSEYHKWSLNVSSEGTNLNEDQQSAPEVQLRHALRSWLDETPDTNPIRSEEKPYGILHLSDTHYDPDYKVGSLANCSEPLCCQEDSGTVERSEDAAKTWGDYRRCDLPQRTFENMLEHIRDDLGNQVDFAYWTGDLPAHDLWKITEESNEHNFNITSTLIRKILSEIPGGNFKVYPTIGNHESVPPNMFTRLTSPRAARAASPFEAKTRRLYDFLWDSWRTWLPPEAEHTFRTYGFYSARPRPGLKLLSLNTNYCYYFNFWLLLDSRDPANQLEWLQRELADSEAKGESVHIIGHIPPGLADCVQPWSFHFHRIVHRFRRTIKAQFYGHTHYDEFIVYYDAVTRRLPINIAYIAPSVTTYSYLNPSFRVYRADSQSHNVVDHETYFLNLTDANESDEPCWELEYSAKRDLGLEGLTPRDWSSYIDRMAQEPAEFERFYTRFLHSSDEDFPCDQRCARRQLCRMKTDIAHDYRACGWNSSGLLDSIMTWNATGDMSEMINEIVPPDFTNLTALGDSVVAGRDQAVTTPSEPQPSLAGSMWSLMHRFGTSVKAYFPTFFLVHNSVHVRSQLRKDSAAPSSTGEL